MTKITTRFVHLKPLTTMEQVIRLVTVILMIGSLVACAVAPTTESSVTGSAERVAPSTGLVAAVDMYITRNYPGAIREFDNIIANEGSSANDRRLAHLGKAMVYLGDDVNWHSMENAKISLISAGQIAPGDNGEFAAETDLLMDAVIAVIGTESKFVALQAKTSASGSEIKLLRQELDRLKKERDELLAEQKTLNEAIERLKQLTLGN
jgi:hypothetical protein